ncbi:hypothetical protein LTSEMIN_3898 [Salmonella enterica subsp. enterica serovar Minnesota str. A4-603]|nr:hypothetical protein LTSEMIN_3898 [Salmonella enterica subsp. enterica serovar Minnesota str. A4-603]
MMMFVTPASPAMIVAIRDRASLPDNRRDRASLPDNRVHTLYAYPSRDDSRCHGATSDFYAIHNGCASNPGRASDHRPSSYRNHRDRQSVI